MRGRIKLHRPTPTENVTSYPDSEGNDEIQAISTSRDRERPSGKEFRRGDVATIVYSHPANGGEVGHSIEIFNAVGDTTAVTAVPESFLEQLTVDEICTFAR